MREVERQRAERERREGEGEEEREEERYREKREERRGEREIEGDKETYRDITQSTYQTSDAFVNLRSRKASGLIHRKGLASLLACNLTIRNTKPKHQKTESGLYEQTWR